jgi:hypothetical protein
MRILAIFLTLASVLELASGSPAPRTKAPARGTLVLGILTVESSYAEDIERPSRGVPDTLQLWLGADRAWRIKTYAIDHDVHAHRLGLGPWPAEWAREHIQKHYGDVLASLVILDFPDTTDRNAAQRVLTQHKLKGHLEIAKRGFAFWNPDGGQYETKTKPK